VSWSDGAVHSALTLMQSPAAKIPLAGVNVHVPNPGVVGSISQLSLEHVSPSLQSKSSCNS
jgi:hypothetical protein